MTRYQKRSRYRKLRRLDARIARLERRLVRDHDKLTDLHLGRWRVRGYQPGSYAHHIQTEVARRGA